jgi:8-oxo-dGTP pyrophosphatase MutT (NUDIX family)
MDVSIALVLKEHKRMADTLSLEKRIANALNSRPCHRITDERAIPSAVLLFLFQVEQAYRVLLTKRSDTVACHKGEVSFPGGTVDPEDRNPLQTALRESNEEVGIQSKDVKILGRLDDNLTTTTGFLITPYVGVIPYPYPFKVNSDEIAKLIFIPLQVLKERFRCETASSYNGNGSLSEPSFHYKDDLIWGATARILRQFIDLVCHL